MLFRSRSTEALPLSTSARIEDGLDKMIIVCDAIFSCLRCQKKSTKSEEQRKRTETILPYVRAHSVNLNSIVKANLSNSWSPRNLLYMRVLCRELVNISYQRECWWTRRKTNSATTYTAETMNNPCYNH